MELLVRSGVGRDINRHYYTPAEVRAALEKPLVQRLIEIIRLRNAHPAFDGEPKVESTAAHAIAITWRLGEDWARLKWIFPDPVQSSSTPPKAPAGAPSTLADRSSNEDQFTLRGPFHSAV